MHSGGVHVLAERKGGRRKADFRGEELPGPFALAFQDFWQSFKILQKLQGAEFTQLCLIPAPFMSDTTHSFSLSDPPAGLGAPEGNFPLFFPREMSSHNSGSNEIPAKPGAESHSQLMGHSPSILRLA